MTYNPNKHHRRSIRLKGYDYSANGAYFITICAHQRQCLFGEIENRVVNLSEYGQIASHCWQQIPQHFPHVEIDAFVVMPNHLHGLVIIAHIDRETSQYRSRGMALPCPYPSSPPDRKFGQPIAGSISTIIGSFKSAVTKRINQMRQSPGTPVWQRNYYEHIVRNELSYQQLCEYIHNNPVSWELDRLHPDRPS